MEKKKKKVLWIWVVIIALFAVAIGIAGMGDAEAEKKPEFTMLSNDVIGATKHTVESTGTYEVVCVEGHGTLIINDGDLFVFAKDEYKGTEYSGLTYEEKATIELKGNDELLARAFNSSEFKLEFYIVE